MFNRKKIALLFLSVTTLNALIPIASVSADTLDNSEQVITYDVKLAEGEFIGEDGNIYNADDLISAFENRKAIITELENVQGRSEERRVGKECPV